MFSSHCPVYYRGSGVLKMQSSNYIRIQKLIHIETSSVFTLKLYKIQYTVFSYYISFYFFFGLDYFLKVHLLVYFFFVIVLLACDWSSDIHKTHYSGFNASQ